MDFGDLNDDQKIQNKLTNFKNVVNKIQHTLDLALTLNNYDSLCTRDKVNYDLFLSYSLNTLFWLYLRTKGVDPNKNDVKNELSRIREYMLKAKEVSSCFSNIAQAGLQCKYSDPFLLGLFYSASNIMTTYYV